MFIVIFFLHGTDSLLQAHHDASSSLSHDPPGSEGNLEREREGTTLRNQSGLDASADCSTQLEIWVLTGYNEQLIQ